MIETILAQTLIYLSVALFAFSFYAKVYESTNIVFHFYMSVFTLALTRSLFNEKGVLFYGDFYDIHFLVISILFLIVVIEFFRKPKRYFFVAPLIVTSILVMLYFLIYDYDNFFIAHNGILIIDMLVVTYVVLYRKFKSIEKVRKIHE